VCAAAACLCVCRVVVVVGGPALPWFNAIVSVSPGWRLPHALRRHQRCGHCFPGREAMHTHTHAHTHTHTHTPRRDTHPQLPARLPAGQDAGAGGQAGGQQGPAAGHGQGAAPHAGSQQAQGDACLYCVGCVWCVCGRGRGGGGAGTHSCHVLARQACGPSPPQLHAPTHACPAYTHTHNAGIRPRCPACLGV
jgi:hypothetical protein